MKINSTTTTEAQRFEFTLEINEDNEILGATTFTYHCSVCGNEVESEGLTVDEAMSCDDHPEATIDTIYANVELVKTPCSLGDDQDTDVIFFTPDSKGLAGSFGLQVVREDGSLKAICDLDGDTLSSSATWIIPKRVPTAIAEHAEAICS